MIIRFRGKEGMFRVEADASTPFTEVVERLAAQLSGYSTLRFASSPNKPPTGYDSSWDQEVGDLGISHGDILFFDAGPVTAADPSNTAVVSSKNTASRGSVSNSSSDPPMHPVDMEIAQDPGKVKRHRSKFCRHDDRGMCEYCKPLEPYDEQLRADRGFKHLSLWSEVRRMRELGRRPEQPFYGVKSCRNHPPFPDGICSKCQPQPISLSLQKFRIVDHVEFASSDVVNNFVKYWRDTNTQRAGFLVGAYKRYDAVPLGQRAVVHAIWEPDQNDFLDGLSLGQDISSAATKAAHALGLEIVGVIWTDIVDAGKGDGSVICKRHAESYFMSSQEVLFSARLQKRYPNILEGAAFSSKFVTCIVSGNTDGQIDLSCYQAAAAAESLADAGLVEPSVNPAIVRVKPRTATLYVPEVNYKKIDQYGNAVSRSAKPSFPTDFLLVSLSHGFSESGKTLVNRFPIENRPAIRTQTPAQLVEQLGLVEGFDSDSMPDFHLLVYLFGLEVLNEEEEKLVAKLLRLEREGTNQSEIMDTATQLAYSGGMSTLRAMA